MNMPAKPELIGECLESPTKKLKMRDITSVQCILGHSNDEELWRYLNDWTNTSQFKELTLNDIDNKEMSRIIEALINHNAMLSKDTEELMVSTILEVLNSRCFQQYFKYNIDSYCNLLTSPLSKMKYCANMKNFLKKVSYKFLTSEEGFFETFICHCLVPLAACLETFDDEELFLLACSIIQKDNPEEMSLNIKIYFITLVYFTH